MKANFYQNQHWFLLCWQFGLVYITASIFYLFCRIIVPFQQIRPSVKDGEFGSQPKRALSGTESGNQLTGQELNIKKVI